MSILIETERQGALRQRITAANIDALYADVPLDKGGEGGVPDPHDYFDMSLGTCKALTVMLYARKKEMPLEGVTVRVSRDDSDERNGHYRLEVTIELAGELSAQARDRLLEVAENCPIHKLMTTSAVETSTSAHMTTV
ncbi:OsmC family protein [Phytohalomonas tamaricis]|uniref:OsmC family protein n=1 Tax=Phytohalomonas tamaricis TaxID=2081032 RepID=UPI000D0AF2A8|nr:OsmC family protein [Phytohalomonas tamaricis]